MGAVSISELPPCSSPFALTLNATSPRFTTAAGSVPSPPNSSIRSCTHARAVESGLPIHRVRQPLGGRNSKSACDASALSFLQRFYERDACGLTNTFQATSSGLRARTSIGAVRGGRPCSTTHTTGFPLAAKTAFDGMMIAFGIRSITHVHTSVHGWAGAIVWLVTFA